MSRTWSRRDFLATSGGLLAGVGAASLLPGIAFADEKPKMCVACRDYHLRLLVPSVKNCWDSLQLIGADGVELELGDDMSLPQLYHTEKKYTLATPEGIAEVKADAQAAGRRITAILMSNRFDQRPEFEVELCTKAAKAAQALGTKVVRLDTVVHDNKTSMDAFCGQMADLIQTVLAATESTGVSFGAENHGVANDPKFLRAMLDRVGSPRFGITLDTANFYWYGFPLTKLYELYESFAPHVVHTHCKSIKYPAEKQNAERERGWEYGNYNCPVYEGDIDFGRVVAILKKVGYSNDLCIENESLNRLKPAEEPGVLKREVDYLRSFLV
jgi:sugar phosphate isomerase/epimerase